MLAEKWGMPPWTVDSDISQEWFERASAYYDVISELNAPKSKGGRAGSSLPKGMEGMKNTGPAIGGKVDPNAGGNLIWPK